MNAKLPFLFFVCAFFLAGCGGGGAGVSLDLGDPASYKSVVENPYFPLERGTLWIYEGDKEGQFRYEEIRVLEQPFDIWGIPCVALRDEQFLDGDLAEVTTEYFAEDRDGNVWKFGEESIEFSGTTFARTPDSWIAGDGDALPWMMISATPAVGEQYVGYQPGGQDIMFVQSLSAVVSVPAGLFSDCLEILESPDDVEDQDIILYAAGVGRVQEISSGGRIDLVAVQTN